LSSESIAQLQGHVISNLQVNNTKMTRSMSGSSNDSNEDVTTKTPKLAPIQLSPSTGIISSPKEQQEQQQKQKKQIQHSFVLIEVIQFIFNLNVEYFFRCYWILQISTNYLENYVEKYLKKKKKALNNLLKQLSTFLKLMANFYLYYNI
jgi:hypothetical protein